MKKLLLIALWLFAGSAHAGLIGATVEGTLGFNFPPGSGQFWPVPTQVVGAGAEYFYTDGANDDTADFFDTGLIITDLVKSDANGWKMTFQSAAFIGATLIEISDNFTNGGVDFSIVGDLLTFTWVGTATTDGLLTAEYAIRTAVPAPAPLALIGIALLGLGFTRKAKRS